MFNLSASTTASEISNTRQVGINVNIPPLEISGTA